MLCEKFWHVGTMWQGHTEILHLVEKHKIAFWSRDVQAMGDTNALSKDDYAIITEPDSLKVKYIARAASKVMFLSDFRESDFDTYPYGVGFRLCKMVDVAHCELTVQRRGRFYEIKDELLQRRIRDLHENGVIVRYLCPTDEDLPEVLKAKQVLVDARIGQKEYRKKLEFLWGGKCAVTGDGQHELLRASHAKPWSVSHPEECIDENNGLLLSAELDALFDSGLITFDENGFLVCSDMLSGETIKRLNLSGVRLRCGCPSKELRKYLKYHAKHIFKDGVGHTDDETK